MKNITLQKTPRWATAQETASYAKISCEALKDWRSNNFVPLPFHKLGKKIIYDLNDVDQLILNGKITHSSDSEGGD